MNAIGYLRTSTPEQNLEIQRQLIQDYAHSKRITLSAVFQDSGKSGTTLDREGLQQAVAALNSGDYLIVSNAEKYTAKKITIKFYCL